MEKVDFEIFIFSCFLRFLSHITLSLALPWRAKQTAQIVWTYTRYIFLNLTQTVRSQKRQQLSITLSPPSGFRRRGHHQAVKVLLMVIHKGQTYEMFANKETRASICSKLKTNINHCPLLNLSDLVHKQGCLGRWNRIILLIFGEELGKWKIADLIKIQQSLLYQGWLACLETKRCLFLLLIFRR